MIKYGVLFLVCMVVSLDARINIIDEKFVQYQCQNCRAPLEIQDLLLAQAEAVWEREIVYLCQRCRKEKQKGKNDPAILSSQVKHLYETIDGNPEVVLFRPKEETPEQKEKREKKKRENLIFNSLPSRCKIQEFVHFESGTLVVTKKDLFWLPAGSTTLGEYSENSIAFIEDPIERARICSHDPKNKISSKAEQDAFIAGYLRDQTLKKELANKHRKDIPPVVPPRPHRPKDSSDYEIPVKNPELSHDSTPTTYLINGVWHSSV